MSSDADPVNLSPLEDAYEIVGELRGRDDVRELLGRRRGDGLDVLVTVAQAADSSQREALTHLAADARLLGDSTQRNLIPILESRWLGTDALAVISPRQVAPTLWELVARGDRFSTPRIAEILHEVNGLLTWAREQKVVHRGVTARTIVLEHGSGDVAASFAFGSAVNHGAPNPDRDVVTIAALAWTMLTGTANPGASSEPSLVALRPDLPKRVVEETEARLRPARPREGATDVLGYIALIALSDTLMVGETDAARLHAELVEKRAELERYVSAERAELDRFATAEREKLAADRLELERFGAMERERLAEDQRTLERALAAEREALERSISAEREQLASDRRDLEDQRAEAERHWAEAQREMLEFDGRRNSGGFADGQRIPATPGLKSTDREIKLSRLDVASGLADAREIDPAIEGAASSAAMTSGEEVGLTPRAPRSKRASPMLLGVLVVLIGTVVSGVVHVRDQTRLPTTGGSAAAANDTASANATTGSAAWTVFDSAGGNVISPDAAPFAALAATPLVVGSPVAVPSGAASNPRADSVSRDTTVQRDTSGGSGFKRGRDSLARPRADTSVGAGSGGRGRHTGP